MTGTLKRLKAMFQHTAARRRLGRIIVAPSFRLCVSTHSRPKAAGNSDAIAGLRQNVSTHSRPKAAGLSAGNGFSDDIVSTHSRPKAAGRHLESGLGKG